MTAAAQIVTTAGGPSVASKNPVPSHDIEGSRGTGLGFFAQLHTEGDCWLWTGYLDKDGYGKFWDGSRYWVAHRFSYLALVGRITPRYEIDHLCRVRACCNPAHLEAVTPMENNHRIPVRDLGAYCKRGHPRTPENTTLSPSPVVAGRMNRQCKVCRQLSFQRQTEKRRAARKARHHRPGSIDGAPATSHLSSRTSAGDVATHSASPATPTGQRRSGGA